MMRVLQLAKYFPPFYGGIEVTTQDISESLLKRSVHCDVLCSSHSPKSYGIENWQGYTVYRSRTLGTFASTAISRDYLHKFKQIVENYDILHIHFPNPLAHLAVSLAKPLQKIVVHWHSDILKASFMKKLYQPFQSQFLKKADIILATSPNYITHSQVLRPYSHKCKVLPSPINIEKLKSDKKVVEKIKNTYNGKKLVFSLGRFVPYKGFKYLIEAAKYLCNDTLIIIGGTGELESKMNRLIQNNNLTEKVKLLGRIDDKDLGSYFDACDIFCLPSISKAEAFGLVQLEAMAFKKPIISTNIKGSGVSWVNQHNRTGLIVPPKNSKAIAEAIEKLSKDPVTYRALAEGARQRLEEEFTVSIMSDSLIEIYSKILKDG